jgi:hypothetical protein
LGCINRPHPEQIIESTQKAVKFGLFHRLRRHPMKQGFLHVQNVRGAMIHQTPAMAQHSAQRHQFGLGAEGTL